MDMLTTLTVITFLASIVVCCSSLLMIKLLYKCMNTYQRVYVICAAVSGFIYSVFQFRWILDYDNVIATLDELGWAVAEFLFCFTICIGLYSLYQDKRSMFIKEEMKTLKTLLLTFGLVLVSFTVPCMGSTREKIKIVEIHSYTPDYVCTSPQRESFRKKIKDKHKGDVDITSFYMNSKLENTSADKKKKIADEFIHKIEKINPDYIYTTDDTAFEYVGIPLLNQYKVFASGLNRPVSEYSVLYNLKMSNLFAVEEMFRLDQLYRLYESINLKYPIYYFILEDVNDASETSVFMEKNYRKEVLGKGTIQNIHVKTQRELKEKLIDLNTKSFGVIVVIAQRIRSDDTGEFLDKEEIVKEIVKINKKHLELAGNPEFSNVGISVCCSPSFEAMGESCGERLADVLDTKMFIDGVVSSMNKLVVNTKRLNELKLSDMYKKESDLISKRVTTY